ncbi:centrobin [Teleopsis dalmanni]|uniref:centrobin n=1 Tax=Teleopsis dalmanni TaxID=139649 RepID=UPI0018CE52DC|nr:centrobin [Teleopsis dalmanni]
MSESDDTDILLRIPPNYFMKSAEKELLEQEKLLSKLRKVDRRRSLGAEFEVEFQKISILTDNKSMDAVISENQPPPPTAAYKFLSPKKKTELNDINSRLHALADEDVNRVPQFGSDISSISTSSTIRTNFGKKCMKIKDSESVFVHSTPKSPIANNICDRMQENAMPQDDVISEINNFFEDRQYCNNYDHYSEDVHLESEMVVRDSFGNYNDDMQLLSSPKFLGLEQLTRHESTNRQVIGNNLISLSDIWGKSGQGTAIACTPNLTLKEEQLRRQHLEKIIRGLQSRLLEYQQRLSVAIEVDRSKDAALTNSRSECRRLELELKQMHELEKKWDNDHSEYNEKLNLLQKELSQAVGLVTKFEEKNEKLEKEVSDKSRKYSECSNTYKQQLEELEIKLQVCQKSEEIATNELNKFKDKYTKVEYQNEKLKMRCDEFEKDLKMTREQKEILQEYHNKQKNRADSIDSQKKTLQETIDRLTENETALKRKLELQQKTLKTHYQQQLENVVGQKLKEFQAQLDKAEDTLKAEARDRERLIAERAVKQLELINEKNELELNLLQEKNSEEVSLYRIQLANASKKIEDLETKLDNYRSKRADIAEKLHGVMETQWQKALEILTSPSYHSKVTQTETGSESPEDNDKHNTAIIEINNTPKTSKSKKNNSKENNLNLVSHKEQIAPVDRLQAYIELLLSKSPSDFEKLDEILALSKHKSSASKLNKSSKRFGAINKPPWKA